MEKDDQQNLFDNPAAIILLIAILIGGYIIFSSQSQTTTAPENKTVQPVITTIYTKITANVRSCASIDCKIIGTYAPNESFDLTNGPYAGITDISQLPDWLLLNFSDGTSGYISKTVLSDHQATQNSQTESNFNVSGSNMGFTKITNTKEKDLPTIIKEWRPGVAFVTCSWIDQNPSNNIYDAGSGFVTVNYDGRAAVLTNAHVISNPIRGFASSCFIAIPDHSQTYFVPSSEIRVNVNNLDWGSLTIVIPDDYIKQLAKNDSQKVICKRTDIGKNVVVLGYPDYGGIQDITATPGIVSGYDGNYYTTSAKIESGNSGGVAVQPENNCFLGIPSAVRIGNFDNLGRILSSSVIYNQ